MKKRILSLVVVLAMMLTFVPCIYAADIAESGSDTDLGGLPYEWTLDSNGVLTVTEENVGFGFDWEEIRNKVKKVVIREGAVSIYSNTFEYFSELESVELPEGLEEISYLTFTDCTSLKSVNIPSSYKRPNREQIFFDKFFGCGQLNISVSEDNSDFCSIDGIVFSKDKKDLLCYRKDDIEPRYTVPSFVTRIGEGAFGKCDKLTNVYIPQGVSHIAIGAFLNCSSLKLINIPESVKQIDADAFFGCTSLTDVYYSGSEEEWNSIDFTEGNDALKNANIHFNAVPTITNIQPDENGEKLTVTMENIFGKGILISAFYNNGVLSDVKLCNFDNAETENNIDVEMSYKQTDSVKIFVWDNLNGITPLCSAKTQGISDAKK